MGGPIKGGDGNDRLTGSSGNDAIKGGDGDDFVFGDADTVLVPFFRGGDDLLRGGDGNDTLFGDVLSSGPDGAVLGGDDTLLGGDGDDLLWGDGNIGFSPGPSQGGDDLLRGGDGSDHFLFSGAFGNDVIRDFTQGEDKLGFPSLNGDVVLSLGISDLQITPVDCGTMITVDAGGTLGTVALVGFTGSLTQDDLLA